MPKQKHKEIALIIFTVVCIIKAENHDTTTLPADAVERFKRSSELMIKVYPDSAKLYVNKTFMGEGSHLVNNLEPGWYKVTAETSLWKKVKAVFLHPEKRQKLFLIAARPKLVLSAGWEVNFSSDGLLAGPSVEGGAKIDNHYFGGSYQYCFLSNKRKARVYYDNHFQLGGGIFYYYDFNPISKYSFSLGTNLGYWGYIRGIYDDDEEETLFTHWYFLYCGPSCMFNFDFIENKTSFAIRYTAYIGGAFKEDKGDVQKTVAVKNAVQFSFIFGHYQRHIKEF